MQSVSQYNTADPGIRHESTMISGHLPRRTLPAVISTAITCASGRRKTRLSRERGRSFSLHYVHMAAELWLDSTAGWLAVVDGSSKLCDGRTLSLRASPNLSGKGLDHFLDERSRNEVERRRRAFG